jgi:hypothetical protein
MLKRFFPVLLLIFLCSLVHAGDVNTRALEACRRACDSFTQKMSANLHDVILENGIVGAIAVCAERVKTASEEFSKTPGLTIERITLLSLKEQKRLESFEGITLQAMYDSLKTGKEISREVSHWAGDSDNAGSMVYVTPIMVEPLCLTCHGPAEMVQPDVREIMQTKYHALPSGDAIGNIKGALVVTLELPAGNALLEVGEEDTKTD